jgi:hypothetical protein
VQTVRQRPPKADAFRDLERAGIRVTADPSAAPRKQRGG